MVSQRNRTCHNASWVHRLRNRHIKQPIIVIEYFGIFRPGRSLVYLKLFFDVGSGLAYPGVLCENPLVLFFEFCILFGKSLNQLGARRIFQTIRKNDVFIFVKEIKSTAIFSIAKYYFNTFILQQSHCLAELFFISLVLTIPTQSQSATNLINATFRLDCANRKNKSGFFLPKPIDDVVINQVPLRGGYINVNVSDLLTILIAKPTEYGMPCFGVQVCRICYISHARATTRAAIKPNRDAMRFAPGNKLAHKEHETRHLNLVKYAAFLFDSCLKRFNLLWSNCPFFNLRPEIILNGFVEHFSIPLTIKNRIFERHI